MKPEYFYILRYDSYQLLLHHIMTDAFDVAPRPCAKVRLFWVTNLIRTK